MDLLSLVNSVYKSYFLYRSFASLWKHLFYKKQTPKVHQIHVLVDSTNHNVRNKKRFEHLDQRNLKLKCHRIWDLSQQPKKDLEPIRNKPTIAALIRHFLLSLQGYTAVMPSFTVSSNKKLKFNCDQGKAEASILAFHVWRNIMEFVNCHGFFCPKAVVDPRHPMLSFTWIKKNQQRRMIFVHLVEHWGTLRVILQRTVVVWMIC